MATWSCASHPGVVGFGLRNELRAIPGLDLLNARGDWYKWMAAAGDVVHAAHPEGLVVVGWGEWGDGFDAFEDPGEPGVGDGGVGREEGVGDACV